MTSFLLGLLLLLVSQATAFSVGSYDDKVQVYDHVFSAPTQCELLHKLAVDHAERGLDGSSIFYRRKQQDVVLTPLEMALDSILEQLGDPNPVVEYWSRQEYLNLDAHADVDEEELEDDGTLRYPAAGHVLYLGLGDDTLRGPTAVLPTQLGGWTDAASTTIPLFIVPAVPGRVLRFPGSAMHAVPKPATRWLSSPIEQTALDDLEEEDEEEDEDDWDDDEDLDDENDDERSVILFNTWSDRGPRGVPVDSSAGLTLPDGISIEGVDEQEFLKQEQRLRAQEWESLYGKGMRDLLCAKQSAWNHVPILHQQSTTRPTHVVSIPLMGTQQRRLHSHKFVQLKAGAPELQTSFKKEIQPTRIDLVAEVTI